MESVEHRFFSCPLAQQVCCYVANIIWQLFAKQGNLGPWKSSSMMQCLFDQPLSKSLNSFSCIWFFSRSGLPWIIWHQRSDLSSNALQWPMEKYTKLHGTPYLPMADLSGNEPSRIWKKHQMLLIRMSLKFLTTFGVSKVLLLLIAIQWLLGKLDLVWALFLKSPHLLCFA